MTGNRATRFGGGRNPRPLGGFTLVELLVVIAVIGILMAVLTPAVQSAREAARRLKCKSQLRQLGLAARTYESLHEVLPPAGMVDPSPNVFDPRSGPMLSWVVFILPHIDQEKLFAQFDVSRSVFDQPANPQAASLSMLLCPTDDANGRFFTDPQLTGGASLAKGNYAAFVSPYHTDLQLRFPGGLSGSGQAVARIRDGASNTLLISEVRTRAHEQDQRGAWALAWTGASLLAFDMHHDNDSPSASYVPSTGSVGWTQPPNCRGPNMDMLYACPDEAGSQLDGMPCAVWVPEGDLHYLSAAPRSGHPGGVNVVFVDGRVGFLTDAVDEMAMAYLVSADDGKDAGMLQHVQ